MRRVFLLLCLVSFLLAGCGKPAAYEEETAVQTPIKVAFDLRSEQWKNAGQITEAAQGWEVESYLKDITAKSEKGYDGEYRFHAIDGSKFYILQDFFQSGEDGWLHEYYITSFDAETGETSKLTCVLGDLEKENAWIMGMNVVSEKITLLVDERDAAQEKLLHYYSVQLDEQGKAVETVDLLPAIVGSGYEPDRGFQLMNYGGDARGYCYLGVMHDGEEKILILDAKGSYIGQLQKPMTEDAYMRSTGMLPTGERIFEISDLQREKLTYICFDGEKEDILFEEGYDYVANRCFTGVGEILFLNANDELICWNARSGSRERLYTADGARHSECKGILQNMAGKIYLVMDEGEKLSVCGLTPADEEEKNIEIVLEQFGRDKYTKDCAAAYSRENPGVTIVVKECEEDWESQWNRVLAELSSGKGPDILLVSREQLSILQGKGVLADLSEVLPEEELEQIFTPVLRATTIEDKLYGFSFEVLAGTNYVSDKVWQENTWCLEEVLSIIEKREREGTPIKRLCGMYRSCTPERTLYELVGVNIGDSPFVDLQTGSCSFETEEFYRVLELCKKYGEEESEDYLSVEEQIAELKDGDTLMLAGGDGLQSFSREMAMLGDGYRPLGSPTEGESGNYLFDYSMCVVVNEKAGNREIIDDFLCYIMSAGVQREFANVRTVRRDVLIQNVKNAGGQGPAFFLNSNNIVRLEAKPDGSSYLQEYLAYMDGCVPVDVEANVIRDMMMEEARSFFDGQKTAEEAGKIIQNRVQLYLKERK